MNGPGPLSVSARPAACTAATTVVTLLACIAFWTMFRFGVIKAPPTMTPSCAGAIMDEESSCMATGAAGDGLHACRARSDRAPAASAGILREERGRIWLNEE